MFRCLNFHLSDDERIAMTLVTVNMALLKECELAIRLKPINMPLLSE